MKKALITGITGQDGSYLAEFLLEKGYEVHGFVRRTSTLNRSRIEHLFKDDIPIHLHYGDMSDQSSIMSVIKTVDPDEIYNLAAQSHVKVSFEKPEYTANSDALGTLRLLEAIRILGKEKSIKMYQASTSEMYGGIYDEAQNETTPFNIQSPYAAAKLYAHWISSVYRSSYNIFVASGILFNHESPRRGASFVTRKITLGVSRIHHGLQESIALGNLDAERDWGFAKEYAEAMWMMLQHDKPQDFVIATNERHSVREFVEESFKAIGVEIEWRGTGVKEVGVDAKTGQVRIKVDPAYFRPAEVNTLQGDYTLAKEVLGWEPKVTFKELVKIMMEADLNRVQHMHEKFSFFI